MDFRTVRKHTRDEVLESIEPVAVRIPSIDHDVEDITKCQIRHFLSGLFQVVAEI